MKRTNVIKALFIVICMLAAGICYAGTRQETAVSLLSASAANSGEGRGSGQGKTSGRDDHADTGADVKSAGIDSATADLKKWDQAGDDPSGPVEASIHDTESEAKLCYVYICGEVKLPGVYPMEEGSRVYQVVDQAGGFTEAAATEYLNMAEVVQDGLKLVVPAAGELPDEKKYGDIPQAQAGQMEGSAVKTKVNLNTAGKEALMTLTGIGEAKAEDIIRYRTEQGPFRTIEDVMKVSGIKDAAFQKIKNDITV